MHSHEQHKNKTGAAIIGHRAVVAGDFFPGVYHGGLTGRGISDGYAVANHVLFFCAIVSGGLYQHAAEPAVDAREHWHGAAALRPGAALPDVVRERIAVLTCKQSATPWTCSRTHPSLPY